MSFLGKEYTFEKQENMEDFVNALGLTPEQAQGFLNFRPMQKFVQDGDQYTFITETPQNKKEVTFTSGVAFDEKVAERNCKTTFTVDGNTVTQVQTFEDGAVFTFVRQYNDNELVVTISSSKWDGVARRYYKA